MNLKGYKQNKTVELPTGVKVRHRFDHYKNVYILTVTTKNYENTLEKTGTV